jgi:hypothetical protein
MKAPTLVCLLGILLLPRIALASCTCDTWAGVCAPNDAYDLGPCCSRCGDPTTCATCEGLRDGGGDLDTPVVSPDLSIRTLADLSASHPSSSGCQLAGHAPAGDAQVFWALLAVPSILCARAPRRASSRQRG